MLMPRSRSTLSTSLRNVVVRSRGSALSSQRYRKVGRVGAKLTPLKTETRLHERVFSAAGVFDASPECSRKSEALLMQESLCFQASLLFPNLPRQSRLHCNFYVTCINEALQASLTRNFSPSIVFF